MAVSKLQASKFARILALELTDNGWAADEPITADMLSRVGSMRPIYLSDNECSLRGVLQQALDDWRK